MKNFSGLVRRAPLLKASWLLALFLCSANLSACSRKVATDNGQYAPVAVNGSIEGKGAPLAEAEEHSLGGSSHFDMAAEDAIATSCIHAWRKAVNNEDEKGAMAELTALEAKYPQVSTIPLMMGQVKSHFGKNREAILFFEKALKGSEFSTMHRIKLAQAYKKDGQYGKALKLYEQIVKRGGDNPAFASIAEELEFCRKKLGLAPVESGTPDKKATK